MATRTLHAPAGTNPVKVALSHPGWDSLFLPEPVLRARQAAPRAAHTLLHPVIHPYPGQSLSLFLEIADLYQRGPQLDRSLDDDCYIVEDSE